MRGFAPSTLTAAVLLATSLGCQNNFESEPPPRTERPLLAPRNISVRPDTLREQLLLDEDTNGDHRITRDDIATGEPGRGDRSFVLRDASGASLLVEGTYYLSNLLQELTLEASNEAGLTVLDFRRVFARPTDRISGQIRDFYWDALTRRVDRRSLAEILPDEKSDHGGSFVYVPTTDTTAYEHFTKLPPGVSLPSGTSIGRVPPVITAEYLASLAGRHGILVLGLRPNERGEMEGIPFVVPGGRFNEMYGWDSYFEALGLIADGRIELARGMVDNFVYQIEHYGKILNANRTYYLGRSQPPFLTSMALAVYALLPADDASREWLANALNAAITEYETVWTAPPRLTETGLSRYSGLGTGPPPEVEPGHFDAVFRRFARRRGMDPEVFEDAYRAGDLEEPALDRFFSHDRCVRESGHDTTYRWYDPSTNEDRCGDFVTVDLNSLLHKYEIDIADAIDRYFGGCLRHDGECEEARVWWERAGRRRVAMREHLWNEDLGVFFDYNVERGEPSSHYWSGTAFYPLWSCHAGNEATRLLSAPEAARLVSAALARLEVPGGIAASARESIPAAANELGPRQWDYPNGWAPHQMLAWQGLENFGFEAEKRRLVYRWLYTITSNAYWYNGTIPEKYDVVSRSHRVFAEYGNVGTDFSYIAREGFGWMNASYQVGLGLLDSEHRELLDRLVPPEWIDWQAKK